MSTNAVSSKETYSNGKFVAGLFKFLKYAVLVFACLIVFIPLIVVFLGSLKSNTEFLSSNVFALPTKVEWNNYKTAFIDGKVLLGLKNTAIIIMISCTGTIITGTMTAYVLQRFHTLFGKVLKTAFLLATLFPAISMQVTVYRIMNSFHLVGTMAASSGCECVFMGSCAATSAAYAAGITGCSGGCYVHTEITASLGLFAGDGLDLYRSTEEQIEHELTVSHLLPYSHYGTVTNFDGADLIYAAAVSEQVIPFEGIRADFYSSSERILSVCEKILEGRNDKNGERIAFRISGDGRRISAYSEETGYVFRDRLIMICCMDMFDRGEDCAVCGSVPRALEQLAESCGRKIISCGKNICDDESSPSSQCLEARHLASKQLFMHDGIALAFNVLEVLRRRKMTLKEAVSQLPKFAGVNRYIPVDKPSELLERLSVSTGGVLTDGDGGRVTVRPVRTGKGIMLNVESYALEAASELCDFYSEVIKRNAY